MLLMPFFLVIINNRIARVKYLLVIRASFIRPLFVGALFFLACGACKRFAYNLAWVIFLFFVLFVLYALCTFLLVFDKTERAQITGFLQSWVKGLAARKRPV